MGFDLQVVKSVGDIERESWDHLCRGRPFSSQRWYRFGEAAWGFEPAYILLSYQGEPVARAAFWLQPREWLPITSTLVRSGVARILAKHPLFSCAAPLVNQPGLVLPEDSRREQALAQISAAAVELGRQAAASFVLFSYTKLAEAHLPCWAKGFVPLSYSDEDTCLEIHWDCFESYIAGLSQDSRRNYRQNCKKAEALGFSTNFQHEIDTEEALPLIYAVDQYHRYPHRPWTRSLIENAGMVDSTWVCVRSGGQLVGCALLIGDEGVWSFSLLGLDYAFTDYQSVYYQLVYGVVRAAIESGVHLLYGGGGAYEFKRRLGFARLPDDCMVAFGLNRFFSMLLKGMEKFMHAKGPGQD